MEPIFNRIYPKILLFTIFVFLSTICLGQQGLDFESRKFKKTQTYNLKEIQANIKSPFHKNGDADFDISKNLDTIIHDAKEQLSHGKFIVENFNADLVGNLDSLNKYINKLAKIKKEYDGIKILDLNDPKNANEYGKIYNKALLSISEYKDVLEVALKNKSDASANGIPEIDGLNSKLSPSIKIAGQFNVKDKIDVSGAIFIGNNLNDETNKQVIYNPNSSSYGINLVCRGNLYKSESENVILSGNFFSSFTEKSLFRDSTSSLSFNLIDLKFGLEVIFYKGFSFYYGRNYNMPLNNIEDFETEIDFMADVENNSMIQKYSNVGFRSQYTFTEKKEYSLAFDVNAIILDEDLKSTLETKDPFLLILKLSLTKSLF